MSSIKHNKALYRVVISHYFVAGLFFLALSGMFFFSMDAFPGHYFQPKVLALTHMAALGWGTMIIFGALYQLLPVILETDLYSTRLSWFSFSVFIPGLLLLVCCFWVFEPGLYMQIGGILVLTAILSFSLNVFLTFKNKKQESVYQDFMATSCIWLVLTALLGVLLVFNFRYVFLPQDHLQFLRLHAHMGIAGWFLMLVIGVSSKLVPMFLVSKYQKTTFLSCSYYLVNAALLLFIVDGYYFGVNPKTYLILLSGLTGIGFYMVHIYKCFASRIRKRVDLPMTKSLLSFVWLGLAILLLPGIIYFHSKNNALSSSLSALYGVLLFMGWISTLILGQTFKTLPFIVWVKHYEHLTGKVSTPLPADLINHTLLRIQTGTYILFMLAFITGFLCRWAWLKYLGAFCLLTAALAYCIHIICMLLHKTKTADYDLV